MQTIVNKTFKEIAPGDAATVQRTLQAGDVRAWAAAFGDVDMLAGPAESQGAAGIVMAILTALVGSALPGPGTSIRTTSVQIKGALPIGTAMTARLVVREKRRATGGETPHTEKPPRPRNRERAIRQAMELYRTIGSPGFPTSEVELRAKVERSINRCYYPEGLTRHLLAVQTSGSRVEMLRGIRLPALVLHGSDDPLIPVEAGKDTAANIPGAKLRIIPGMGHDLAAGLLPILINAIAQHCEAADGRSPRATARSPTGSSS